MLSGRKRVNPPRADVRTKKKREVHHTRADVRTKKTREVRAADNVKIMRDELEKGKKGMKRLRLPMAIPETVKEAPMATTLSSVPHESVPDIAPSKLTFRLLQRHLQMKIMTTENLDDRISCHQKTNPYLNKVYKNPTIEDMEEPTGEPEISVECSLSWLLDNFNKAELLLPEDWKTFKPEEMCKSYNLPAEWEQFLVPKDSRLFPTSPDTCELPTASPDDPSQMGLWRKEYTLTKDPAFNHLLATLFDREVTARNEMRQRAQTHNHIMARLTTNRDGELKCVPGVLFLPREQILARNISGCEGSVMYNEYNLDRQKTPQEFIRKWLDPCGISTLRDAGDRISEGAVEREVGHLLHGLHPKAGVFTTLSNQPCTFPPLLTYFDSVARPDFARRPASAMLPNWDKRLLPALWVMEAKASDTTPDPLYGAPQVAPVVMPVLVMFILFYLDTRERLDEDLPPWSFIFSLLYNHEGYNIYVHYPRYDRARKMWGAYSMRFFSEHERIFRSAPYARMRIHALAIFQRMQSHELFVLERFMEWTKRGGYERRIEELGSGLPNF